MSSKSILAVCAALFIIAATATAGEVIERNFTVGDNPQLSLGNVAGNITVVPGRSGEILVTATRDDDRVEVIFEQSGDRVRVKTEYPKRGNLNIEGGVEFEVVFPRRGRLDIKTVSGSIACDEITGRIRLTTVSGNVLTKALAGDISLKTVSGEIIAERYSEAELDATTVNGDIEYSGGSLAGGDYSFKTVSGDINIYHNADASYNISGNTVSGSIKNAAGGDMDIRKDKWTGLNTKIEGSYGGNGTYVTVNTVSGTITIDRY